MSIFRKVLQFKNSPKLSIICKVSCRTMGIFRSTVVVANDISNAKLAIKLKEALLEMFLDWIHQFVHNLVWDVCYPFGQCKPLGFQIMLRNVFGS